MVENEHEIVAQLEPLDCMRERQRYTSPPSLIVGSLRREKIQNLGLPQNEHKSEMPLYLQ